MQLTQLYDVHAPIRPIKIKHFPAHYGPWNHANLDSSLIILTITAKYTGKFEIAAIRVVGTHIDVTSKN